MAGQKRQIKVFSMGSEDIFRGEVRSDKTSEELTSVLAEANGFDLSYLLDNSRGDLGPGQARLLLSKLAGPLLIIIASSGFLIFQIRNWGFFKQLSKGAGLGALLLDLPRVQQIIWGILLAVTFAEIYLLVTILLDLFGGSVAILEGPGWKRITTSTDDDGSTTTRTYYVIADQRFTVKSSGFRVFENGRNYRVYFTPRRKILVNIEALD